MKPHQWKKSVRRKGGPESGGNVMEGVVQHHGGFAFLLSEVEGGSDVFLRGRGLDLAMDGDRVQARVRSEAGGKLSGEIIGVITHARSCLVGILKRSPGGWTLRPQKGFSPAAQVLSFARGITPADGALCTLSITRWPAEGAVAAGTVTEILGSPEIPRARVTALLRSLDIRESFPREVLAQSAALGTEVKPVQWRDREELFHLPVITIDGADAKDFDDAVTLEIIDRNLLRLGVHIADVSHYVPAGSSLDKEAYLRATSVYLPDRVVPMLPPSLSDNLCSLVPGLPRLTLSAFIDINAAGKVVKRRLANTVIKSCRRFTYEDAQAVLEEKKVDGVPAPVAEALGRMGKLAVVLNRVRTQRGALDFNLPEYKVETDTGGNPLRVVKRSRLESHRLIEEFMLLANETVATELMTARAPFLHRRHDAPDPAKLKALAETLGGMDIPAGHILGGNTHKAIQEVLRQASGGELEDTINSLIVRSMRQAVYSPESSGHFGIAARAYTHFTSPIRRYPDLMTHRAVKALLAGRRANMNQPALEKAGTHCSRKERDASDAEHKAVDMLRSELLKSSVGAEMNGVVTAVTESGSFVKIGDTGAEGLLRGARLKPGTRIRVVIAAVDTAKGQIDLSTTAAAAPLPAHWQVIPGRQSGARARRGAGRGRRRGK